MKPNNTRAINLLPWRAARFQQKSLKTLLATGFAILFLCLSWFILQFSIEQQKISLSQTQNQLEQEQIKTSQLSSQIEQLRKEFNAQKNMKAIQQEISLQIMQIISAMPLQKGYLTEFQIDEQHIELKGNAFDQNEFEQVHHFLEQYFDEMNLIEFIPNSYGNLHFEFHLKIKSSQ